MRNNRENRLNHAQLRREASALLAVRSNRLLLIEALLILSAQAQADRPGIEYANAACVIENMLLAATAEGLGSCYIWGMLLQLKEDKALCQKLGIPAGFVPASAVLLGYAADEPRPKTPEVKIAMNRV